MVSSAEHHARSSPLSYPLGGAGRVRERAARDVRWMSTIERSMRCDDGWARRYARAQETGELDRGDPDAGRGRVDEDVLARLQLAEHNQRLVRCMYA
jgi:hypothetical protein